MAKRALKQTVKSAHFIPLNKQAKSKQIKILENTVISLSMPCHDELETIVLLRLQLPDRCQEGQIHPKFRDTPPISIAILLQKSALLLAGSTVDTPPFVLRCPSPLYCDAFAEVLGSGVVGTLPNNVGLLAFVSSGKKKNQ